MVCNTETMILAVVVDKYGLPNLRLFVAASGTLARQRRGALETRGASVSNLAGLPRGEDILQTGAGPAVVDTLRSRYSQNASRRTQVEERAPG